METLVQPSHLVVFAIVMFFVFLAIATIAYLALVEVTKAIFYRALSGPTSHAAR